MTLTAKVLKFSSNVTKTKQNMYLYEADLGRNGWRSSPDIYRILIYHYLNSLALTPSLDLP